MSSVKARPILDYFKVNLAEMDAVSLHLPFVIRWGRVFHPFVMMSFLLIASLLGGMFSEISLSLFWGLLVFLGLNYLWVRGVAKKIHLRRTVKKAQCFEFEEVVVLYRVINSSHLTTPPLMLRDTIATSQESSLEFPLPILIPPTSHRSFTIRRPANSGMGIKKLGVPTLTITDPFGIFEFYVSAEESDCVVEVLPAVEDLPDLGVIGSFSSNRYGLFDVQAKGNSVNFVGVREYEKGDSLKHIAWKLSAKRGELFVKEFEKMVNAEVSLFLNLDPRLHQGSPGLSTWEIAKDVSLSFVSQQISAANSVRVFSQKFYMDSIHREQDSYELAKQLIELDPLQNALNLQQPLGVQKEIDPEAFDSTEGLIRKYLDQQTLGTNIVLVTPFILKESEPILKSLRLLKGMGCEVFCLLIDSASFYHDFSQRLEHKIKFVAPTMTGVTELADQLSTLGIHVAVIDPDRPVGESLLKTRVIS